MNAQDMKRLFYRADYITFVIRNRLKLNPFIATILWCALNNTILLIATIQANIVFSKGTRIGLLNDWGWWIITVIFNTMFYIFLWIPDGVSKTILGLQNNKVIKLSTVEKEGDEEETLDKFLQKFLRSYSNRLLYIISLVPTILLVISIIHSQRELILWLTANNFIFWFVMFLYAQLIFLGTMNFIRIVVVIFWFTRLLRDFDVNIQFLHPDHAGGLSPLSDFSITITYAVIVTAIAHVLGDISEATVKSTTYFNVVKQSYVLVDYLFYCIFASFAFFAPLYIAHTKMKKAKNELITMISDQFNAELACIQPFLVGDRAKLMTRVSKLEDLHKLHVIADKFPIWPYNIGYLTRFIGAIISPLLISVLSIVIEQIFL